MVRRLALRALETALSAIDELAVVPETSFGVSRYELTDRLHVR